MHTHILPGMDDGSKDPAMSVNMLRTAMNQGVERVLATPHYYPVESVSDFLARRTRAAQTLKAAMTDAREPLPEVYLAAEVAYRPGIGYEEDLKSLCIGKSEYLLLELPFDTWGPEVLRDIRNMTCAKGITPVLAHLERYLRIQKKKVLQDVLAQGVLVQMNAEAVLQRRTKATAMKMLKSGAVHLLGSDCHNMTTRAPNLGSTVQQLRQLRGMDRVLDQISFIGTDILEQAQCL